MQNPFRLISHPEFSCVQQARRNVGGDYIEPNISPGVVLPSVLQGLLAFGFSSLLSARAGARCLCSDSFFWYKLKKHESDTNTEASSCSSMSRIRCCRVHNSCTVCIFSPVETYGRKIQRGLDTGCTGTGTGCTGRGQAQANRTESTLTNCCPEALEALNTINTTLGEILGIPPG